MHKFMKSFMFGQLLWHSLDNKLKCTPIAAYWERQLKMWLAGMDVTDIWFDPLTCKHLDTHSGGMGIQHADL